MTIATASAAALLTKWPDNLVQRIVADDWALVIGAGLSRNASNGTSNPLGWKQLIEQLSATFTSGDERKLVDELVRLGQFLDAAEVVKQSAVAAGKEHDFRAMIRAATDGAVGTPFKASPLHEKIINELAPSLIITTNYDRLIERASDHGYSVHRPGDLNLGADVRTGTPALVKPHGTVDDLSNIVLTRSDYATIRHRAAELYRVMEAVFLTKTCLFVGYSFQDPDLMLLLENSFGGASRAGAHYWLAPSDGPMYLQRLFQEHYGIEMITYDPKDSHIEMKSMIEALCFTVSSSR